MKTCTKCGRRVPAEALAKGKRYCKVCDAARSRNYYAAHRADAKASQRRNRERNRERDRRRVARWKLNNPDAYREWCRANPDRIAEYNARYYALTRGAPSAERIFRDEVILRDLGRCGVCDEPIMGTDDDPRERLTLDHITPVTKDGPHVMENVQLAHARCNSSKGNRV